MNRYASESIVMKSPLRALVGAEKFDRLLSSVTQEQLDRGVAIKALGTMRQEPDNSGMDIERGREALREAVNRSYTLPAPPRR